MTEVADDFRVPVPLDENDHQITVYKCRVKRSRIEVVDSEPQTLNLKEAVALLAPSGTHRARANVMGLKAGFYIGVKKSDSSNFVIVNPTSDGDIRWLLNDHPDFKKTVRDIYLVDGVRIRRNTIDLTEDGE